MNNFKGNFSVAAGGFVANAFDGDPIQNPEYNGMITVWGSAAVGLLLNATLRVDSKTPFVRSPLNLEVSLGTIQDDTDHIGEAFFPARANVVLRLENTDVAIRVANIKARAVPIQI